MSKTIELVDGKYHELSDGMRIQWVKGSEFDYPLLHGMRDIDGTKHSEYYPRISVNHCGINLVNLPEVKRSEENRKDPRYKRFGRRHWIPEMVRFFSRDYNIFGKYRELEIETIKYEIPLSTVDYLMRHDESFKKTRREMTGR